VLVADPLPAPAPSSDSSTNAGSITTTKYTPKHRALSVDAPFPAVLLLNDRFDPGWNVTVDGRPEPLLRCNYIMRGVYLPPGNHVVDFRFEPPHWTLYVSLTGIGLGLVLCGLLAFSGTRRNPSAPIQSQE
jgi:uncharacterized membrane protein YfhO